MDRRTLLALFLMLVVYYAYLVRNPPVPPEDTPTQASAPVEQPIPEPQPPASPPPPNPAPQTVPVQHHVFEACGASGRFTTQGGVWRDVVLTHYTDRYDTQPIYRWLWGLVTGSNPEGGWKPYGDEPSPYQVGGPKAEYFSMGAGELQGPSLPAAQTVQGHTVVYTARTPEGLVLSRQVRPKTAQTDADSCVIELTVTFENQGKTTYSEPMWVGFFDEAPIPSGYEHVRHPAWMVDGSANTWEGPSSSWYLGLYPELTEPTPYPGKPDYFGVTDAYFSVVALPQGDPQGEVWVSPRKINDETTLYGTQYVVTADLAPGESLTETFEVYVGPNASSAYSLVDDRLSGLASAGFFSSIGTPLLWLLGYFHGLVGNWGLAIVLLTVAVKLALFPLTQMSFKSSQAMAQIQPELQRIRETYQSEPEELNRQTLALFKEHGVNPVGGCLPMLLQMPIWIALFRVLQNSVDLYHTEFLYLRDLSAPDPYCVLPALAVGLMMLQQRMMPMGNMDPTQARMMRFLPIVFGIFFFTFPSGLIVYMFVNMCLTMVQQGWIKRRFGNAQPKLAEG